MGSGYSGLKLKNTGAVAKDLRIDITDAIATTKWFAPSLSHDAYLRLETETARTAEAGGTITVKVNYKDADE